MPSLPKVAIGLDLGDRMSIYAVLNARRRVTARGRIPTDRAGLTAWLQDAPPGLVVLEVGPHFALGHSADHLARTYGADGQRPQGERGHVSDAQV
jgi:hypothetical protein